MAQHAGLASQGAVVGTAQRKVVYGRPAAEVVVEEVAALGAKRVFLMSTRSLQGPDSVASQIAAALGDTLCGRSNEVPAHTPREAVVALARQARDSGAELIVAVGGGSVIDASKVVQLCLARGVFEAEGMEALATGIHATPPMPPRSEAGWPVRCIAVPTTFSAAEFTAFAGVTDMATGRKQAYDHPLQIPMVVVLDPAATLQTPLWLLYSTGIRAVDHCVESYCSPRANPLAQAQVVYALRELDQGLRAMQQDPQDLRARLRCQWGMWLSILGLAGGVSTGASHGLGRVLGAVHGVPHGQTSCVFLPAVLRWNALHNGAQQEQLRLAAGLPGPDLVSAVAGLIAALGEPQRLRDVGVLQDSLPDLAERALASGLIAHNPRPLATSAQVLEILNAAW